MSYLPPDDAADENSPWAWAAKARRLGFWSLMCGLVALVFLALIVDTLYDPFWLVFSIVGYWHPAFRIVLSLLGISSLVGVVLAIAAMRCCSRSGSRPDGFGPAIAGLALNIIGQISFILAAISTGFSLPVAFYL